MSKFIVLSFCCMFSVGNNLLYFGDGPLRLRDSEVIHVISVFSIVF